MNQKKSKARLLLDTNVILRFLLADHPKLSLKAKTIFKAAEEGKAELFINHTTVAEVFWVLESFYKVPKKELVQILGRLLRFPNLKVIEKKVIFATLHLITQENISYIDAYNLTCAQKKQLKLKTFDKKLEKLASLN